MALIFLVEDDEHQAFLMRRTLENLSHDIIWRRNGVDFMETVLDEMPDLILLDLRLPDIDGVELLALVKGDPATAGIPVVITTAVDHHELYVQCEAIGFEGYYVKPLIGDELAAVINRFVNPN
ncbi:MAG: response regulator [Chloroflexi bacterium]|nr:response regulator [Chloroflexota bacterium]